MPDLSAHSKASEEDYFRKKEKELIEKLKKKAAAEAHRKGLAEAIGLENQQILDVLEEMGFDRSTVILLFLFPVLQVAWSDGEVTEEEQRVLEENNHSPDLTHFRIVKKGDTLHLMCFKIYGDSKYYIQVAQVNKLGNFRNLAVGSEIFFPPFDKTKN